MIVQNVETGLDWGQALPQLVNLGSPRSSPQVYPRSPVGSEARLLVIEHFSTYQV
jgi:hypothetical protein